MSKFMSSSRKRRFSCSNSSKRSCDRSDETLLDLIQPILGYILIAACTINATIPGNSSFLDEYFTNRLSETFSLKMASFSLSSVELSDFPTGISPGDL